MNFAINLDGTQFNTNIQSVDGTVEDDTFSFIVPGSSNYGSSVVIGVLFGGEGTDTVAISNSSNTSYSVLFNSTSFNSIERLDLSSFNGGLLQLVQSGVALNPALAIVGNNTANQTIAVNFSGSLSAEAWTFSNWQAKTSFVGSASDDTITGSSRNDNIDTSDGNDTIVGSNGFDHLGGGAGNDTFNMQLTDPNAISIISGGPGSDTYVVRQSSPGQVVVTDFTAGAGGDVINVDDILACSVAFDAASNPFDPADGHLRLVQQGADTLLQWDLDGAANGTNPYTTVLTLQGVSAASLTSANFITAAYAAVDPVLKLNHAPAPGLPLAGQTATEDSPFSWTLPASAFSDPDAGDTLTYSASGMPAWLSFDAASRTFGGEFHLGSDGGAFNVSVTATDSHGSHASSQFMLTALPVNDAPAGLPGATLAGGVEDTALNIRAADLLAGFSDEEHDALSVANLAADHGSLAFAPNAVDGDAWIFTPDANYNGPVTLDYKVSDTHGGTTPTQQQHFNLAAVNDAPLVATALAAQTVIRGAPIVMMPITFSDFDSATNGDTLHYSASLADGSPLPDTLQFNPANGSFFGIAGAADAGSYVIRVTASDRADGDPAGLHASGTFSLAITAAPGDIVGSAKIDVLNGTAGNDVIYGMGNSDVLNGGNGNDQLVGGAGGDLLNGGAGSDIMTGQLGDDVYMVDNAGDQVIEKAGGGHDLVLASVGTTLAANVEDLVLTGSADLNGAGNGLDNLLTGNAGNNTLTGNDGNDTLYGGAGRDTLLGGAGNDSYILAREDNFVDTVTEAAGMGTDTVFLFSGSYALVANIENLVLQGSANNGTGNALDNAITGNGLGNVLIGGGGNDQLSGLDGNDTLTGGLGQDQFIFAAAPSRGNVDLIQDFTRGQDQLVLDALAFGGTGLHDRGLDASMFRSGARVSTAGDSNDHVIYDTSAGKLYYDADGAGGAASIQIATLANAPALDAASIFILH